MEEKVYFDQGGYAVTSTRFITPGKTYTMTGVTSVSYTYQSPSFVAPIILIILGIIGIIIGALTHYSVIIIGVILLLIGILILIFRKKTFSVVLGSASGETEAMSSKDEALTSKIVSALSHKHSGYQPGQLDGCDWVSAQSLRPGYRQQWRHFPVVAGAG